MLRPLERRTQHLEEVALDRARGSLRLEGLDDIEVPVRQVRDEWVGFGEKDGGIVKVSLESANESQWRRLKTDTRGRSAHFSRHDSVAAGRIETSLDVLEVEDVAVREHRHAHCLLHSLNLLPVRQTLSNRDQSSSKQRQKR